MGDGCHGAGLALTLLLGVAAVLDGMNGRRNGNLKGPDYGPDQRGRLRMGTCRVSVPKARQFPRLDRSSLVELGVHVNLSENQVLLDVRPSSEENFYRDLQGRVAASSGKQLFVYIHGFNTARRRRRGSGRAGGGSEVRRLEDLQLALAGALLDYTVDECDVAGPSRTSRPSC